MRRVSSARLSLLLAILLPLAIALSLMSGSVALPWRSLAQAIGGWFGADTTADRYAIILFEVRLPRVLLAACAGAVLACCGAVLQGLFRNPLADPSLIGVSSGASVGASLAIVGAATLPALPAGAGLPLVMGGAFAGGLGGTLLVYRLATSAFGTSVTTMLLAGIAVTAVAGAMNSLLSYLADNDMLRQITLWQMGGLSSANWSRAIAVAAVALLLALTLPGHARDLNAFLLGESEARHLGVDVQRVKQRLIVLTALGVGACVAMTGMVAFVGLVVPHLVRLLIGPDHRGLLPCAALGGALLLVGADNLARVVAAPAELPVGIITALLGSPVFIALLLRSRKGP